MTIRRPPHRSRINPLHPGVGTHFDSLRLGVLVMILILLTPLAGQGDSPGEVEIPTWLILVETSGGVVPEALQEAPCSLLLRSDDFLVARVMAGRLPRLEESQYKVLDREPRGAEDYYLIRLGQGIDRETVREAGRLLYQDERFVILKTVSRRAEGLAERGIELIWISPDPKPLAAQRLETRPSRQDYGPLIDQMVDRVSEASYSAYLENLVDFGTRYTYTAECDSAAYYILQEFQALGLEAEFHHFDIGGYDKLNVIATLPGLVYPESTLYITSHYDATSEDPWNDAPGADDNGSGTAAVLETARVVKDFVFARTLKFVCFAGEEQGLVGSHEYVADIFGEPVVGCFNYDMIAYSGVDPLPPDLIIYTNTSSGPLAAELSDAALHYCPTELEPVILVESMSSSDHGSFWQYGYPAILGIEEEAWGADFNPYYHSTQDLIIHCDIPYATSVTRAAVAALAHVANPVSPEDPFLAIAGVVIDDDAVGPSDGNGNGVLEYGETVELGITLQNLGLTTATGTEADLLLEDEFGQVITGHQSFGDIAPGDSAASLGLYAFSVSSGCPDLHELDFDLLANYSPGSMPLPLAVHSPVLSFHSFLVDDTGGGDGDGVPEPGETVEINVRLLNEGSATATGVRALLVSYEPRLEVLEPSERAYGPIQPDSVRSGLPFSVSLDPTLPNPYTAAFSLRASADRGYENENSFHFWVGDIFAHDMEDSAAGWAHDFVRPGYGDEWHISGTRNHTSGGSLSWKCGDTGGGDYAGMLDAGLLSPVVTLSPNYMIEFWYWIRAQLSQGYPGYAYDGGLVEVSVEGGPFEQIEPIDGYPFLIRTGAGPGPLPAETPVFSGFADWTRVEMDLGELEGEAQFRFRFATDASVEMEGWYVDDVRVLPLSTSGVGESEELVLQPAPVALRLYPPHPNPAKPTTTLRFDLPEPGPVTAEIFDVTGRRVKVLRRELLFAGTHEITWDGTDGSGRRAASGIYFCRLQSAGASEVERLVLAR